DPAVLMHATDAAEIGIVFHRDMPADARVRGDHHVAADLAVVSDMRIGHQHIVVAEPRDVALAGRAMDGHALPDDIVVAEPGVALLALELQVLRRPADIGSGM